MSGAIGDFGGRAVVFARRCYTYRFAVPYELFIGLRYTLSGRHDRFVSFVSLLSAAGIALGVAALIVVLAVITGFQNELRGRILSVASHLEALADSGEIADWRALAADLTDHPRVLAAAPNINRQGLLSKRGRVQGALIKGILPAREREVSDLDSYLQNGGDLDSLAPDSFAIILGEQLARRLGVSAGDGVLLVAPQGQVTPAGILPRLKRFTVRAVFSSGVFQYDSNLAYIHLADAQKLYRMEGASSVRLRLDDLYYAPLVARELPADGVYFHDWTQSHRNLFRALAVEKRAMFVILSLIVAVAAFNIVAALVTMVRNKRADIAILRTIGVPPAGIVRVFMLQGLLIGVCGVALGVVGGVILANNADAFVGWLEDRFGFSLFPGDVYQLSSLPSEIVFADVARVGTLAFLLSVAATLYPSWRAARIAPTEILRRE